MLWRTAMGCGGGWGSDGRAGDVGEEEGDARLVLERGGGGEGGRDEPRAQGEVGGWGGGESGDGCAAEDGGVEGRRRPWYVAGCRRGLCVGLEIPDFGGGGAEGGEVSERLSPRRMVRGLLRLLGNRRFCRDVVAVFFMFCDPSEILLRNLIESGISRGIME